MIRRGLIVVSVFFILCMSLLYIRYHYDSLDIKQAEIVFAAFNNVPANKGVSWLMQKMATDLKVDGTSVACNKSMYSRYEMQVLFKCGVTAAPQPVELVEGYNWLVTINENKVIPLNDKAKQLIATEMSGLIDSAH